ncbi:MAG: hypothetical protein WCO71_02465 [Pseudomonadota bacterium]
MSIYDVFIIGGRVDGSAAKTRLTKRGQKILVNNIAITLLATTFAPSIANAEFAAFNHDVFCQNLDANPREKSTSIRISYDKTEYPELGRAGGIHIELGTGISELSEMGRSLGLSSGYRQIIRRAGPAGQAGNSITQSPDDPFVVAVKLGFTLYDLIGPDDQVQQQFPSYISDLKLSRVRETGFHSGSTPDVHEYIELRLLDDYGHHHMRFEPRECKTLN